MAKPRNKCVDYLVYLAVRLGAMFLHMVGIRACYALGDLAGDAAYKFLGHLRRRALGHVQRSYPQLTPAQQERLARLSLRNLAYLGIEVFFTPRLITPVRWAMHIVLKNQQENIRLLLERKTGMIYFTGHFGNWEVVGYTMAALGFPGVAIARPLDNPYLNEYIMGVRQRLGLRILDKKGATEHMHEILARKEYVSFVSDQDAGRKGVFVNFFGRPASTQKSIALLAMSYDLPIVVGYGKRLDRNFRFEIGVARIIHPSEWADKPDPVFWITQEYTAAMEQVVRSAPQQYLWAHRRWKHRPKGEPEDAEGIA